jgi:hypothetical protein
MSDEQVKEAQEMLREGRNIFDVCRHFNVGGIELYTRIFEVKKERNTPQKTDGENNG